MSSELTGFQRDLLFIISGLSEPNGLEIKEEIEHYYESSINHGRLYPNLDTLVDSDLIEKTKRDERTNSYKLTPDGAEFIEMRRAWENQYVEEMKDASV